MIAFETLLYSKTGAVARISLNRPHVRNAYNTTMRDDLYQALSAVKDDQEVRAVVLSGEGPAFCAGADLSEFGTAPSLAVARQVRWRRDIWGLFLSVSKPMIAAIHGYCLGSGVEMALLCDIRIAAEDAVFGLPEASLGLIPAAGGVVTLPRTVGPGAALDLLLTRRRIAAHEARTLGLVTRVAPGDELEDMVSDVAHGLESLEPSVAAAVKLAARRGMDLPLERALELETRLTLKTLGETGAL